MSNRLHRRLLAAALLIVLGALIAPAAQADSQGPATYASGSAVLSAPGLESVREGVAEAALLGRKRDGRVSKRPTIRALALLVHAIRIED